MAIRFEGIKLNLRRPVPSDIEIAQDAYVKPIAQIAEEMGILPEELEFYGPYKAKVKLEILKRLADRPNGTYIDVTAITPTPLGEMRTMPGLPTRPVFYDVDLDLETGKVLGLF